MNASEECNGGRCECSPGYVTPATNIYEGQDAFTMLVEMPGVEQGGLEMWVEKGTLRVHGKTQFEDARHTPWRDECGSGHYRGVYQLSDAVDTDSIGAELRAGLLTITLPKSKSAQPRKIAVRSEQ